jgi:mRNA interferase MazF
MGATCAPEAAAPVRQYELWWAELPEPIGRRPVLLISRDGAYDYLARVMIVEVTTTIRNIPVELSLGRHEGMRQRSVANFDNLHVVPKRALVSRIGALGPGRIPEAMRALGYALDWPALKLDL